MIKILENKYLFISKIKINMSQINQSLDNGNIDKDNKENATINLDYSLENSVSFKNRNNLNFQNKNHKNNDKNTSKEKNNENKLKKNNSFNINERKIISIIGISKVPKQKKIKFNDLPDLCLDNQIKKNISKKNMNNISEKREEDLNSDEIINDEKDMKNYDKFGINCEQMYKELTKLKNENNIIKNKLEELSKNQKNQKAEIKTKKNNNSYKIIKNENPYSPYNKYKKNLNIKKLEGGWNNKIPLLTSYLDNSGNKLMKSKRIYGLNNFTMQNNLATYKIKSEYEKFHNIKNKLILNRNKIISKSESYNNFNIKCFKKFLL